MRTKIHQFIRGDFNATQTTPLHYLGSNHMFYTEERVRRHKQTTSFETKSYPFMLLL